MQLCLLGVNMKKINAVSVGLLIPYLILMGFRPPQISDAIIIISLVSLILVGQYIDYLHSKQPKQDNDVLDLEKQLIIERLNLNIRDVKSEAHKKSLLKINGENNGQVYW